ncbi:hypothetical protein N9L19_01470, partial [bacterium]|nr:hypothetical protein [bacterium]
QTVVGWGMLGTQHTTEGAYVQREVATLPTTTVLVDPAEFAPHHERTAGRQGHVEICPQVG